MNAHGNLRSMKWGQGQVARLVRPAGACRNEHAGGARMQACLHTPRKTGRVVRMRELRERVAVTAFTHSRPADTARRYLATPGAGWANVVGLAEVGRD